MDATDLWPLDSAGVLDVAGRFTMLVPGDWSAEDHGDVIEITAPGSDGVLHLSSYSRRPERVRAEEVADLVRSFIVEQVTTDVPPIRVLPESRRQCRAMTGFDIEIEGQPRHMLVFAVLWPDRFVLCSCIAPTGSWLLTDAEQCFATIASTRRRSLPSWLRRSVGGRQ